MAGVEVRVFLTCVVKSNMYMTHDAINRCTKGPTIKRGSPLAGAWCRFDRSRIDAHARVRIVAPPSVSLPGRGGGDRSSRSNYRTLSANHAQDSRQRGARFASLFGGEWTNAWRDCCACRLYLPEGNAQAWLTTTTIVKSVSTMRLIVCSLPNFSKPTRSWFRTKCVSSVILF
jgi:hypothetical protein